MTKATGTLPHGEVEEDTQQRPRYQRASLQRQTGAEPSKKKEEEYQNPRAEAASRGTWKGLREKLGL